MRRREFISLVGGAAAAWRVAAHAQDAGRTYHLGMMFPFPREARESFGIVDALMDELRRSGFVEGQNLVVEYRAWAAHLDLISDYAAELVKRPLDVLAAGGTPAARAAQKATNAMPILAITGRHDRRGRGSDRWRGRKALLPASAFSRLSLTANGKKF